jgi:hypothetical protein
MTGGVGDRTVEERRVDEEDVQPYDVYTADEAFFMPFAKVTTSGWTRQWVRPSHSPVRPNPVITSSAMKRTSWRSQI